MFRDLTVTGIGTAASFAPTLGDLFDLRQFPEKLRALRHPPTREILKGFEGVVWPGEMLRMILSFYTGIPTLTFSKVVLGRPGAGSSTLLKTLANLHEAYHSVDGFMHYSNGISTHDLREHFRGDVVYCEANLFFVDIKDVSDVFKIIGRRCSLSDTHCRRNSALRGTDENAGCIGQTCGPFSLCIVTYYLEDLDAQ